RRNKRRYECQTVAMCGTAPFPPEQEAPNGPPRHVLVATSSPCTRRLSFMTMITGEPGHVLFTSEFNLRGDTQ
ncbi:hypothetical protein CH063_08406, partial [Colletotrichum higginsianum]